MTTKSLIIYIYYTSFNNSVLIRIIFLLITLISVTEHVSQKLKL